jgi:hypothetical protein
MTTETQKIALTLLNGHLAAQGFNKEIDLELIEVYCTLYPQVMAAALDHAILSVEFHIGEMTEAGCFTWAHWNALLTELAGWRALLV